MIQRYCLLAIAIISGLLQASRPAQITNKVSPFEWGLAARQGDRENMEDEHTLEINFDGQPSQAFFAIYDGHAGAQAAKLADRRLYKYLSVNLNLGKGVEQSFTEAFQSTDRIIMEATDSGACALAAYINGNTAYIAWAGDSRALVIRKGKVVAATVDHKPDTPSETARLESNGIEITPGWVSRVFGLAVSRSLGDRPAKAMGKGGIIATPEIITVALEPGDLIVLACDGVWDVIGNDEAAQLVSAVVAKKQLELTEKNFYKGPRVKRTRKGGGNDPVIDLENNELMSLAARVLRDTAYCYGSGDNISAMVIQYNVRNKPVPIKSGKKEDVRNQELEQALIRNKELKTAIKREERAVQEHLVKLKEKEQEEADLQEAIRKSKEKTSPKNKPQLPNADASRKQIIIDRLTELKKIAEDSKVKKPVIQQIENILLLLQKEPYTLDVLSIASSLLNDINGETEIEYFGQKTKLTVLLEPIDTNIDKEVNRLRPIYHGREW